MKKRGFTLVELIAVIVLLSAILLIIIPVVEKSLKEGKQQLFNNQIESIKTSLATWASENKPKNGETYYLTLSQLKKEGLVEHDLKNPVTDEYLANDMILKVINQNDIITYEVLTDTGSCKSDYIDIPKIDVINIVNTEINSSYYDTMATAKDVSGNLLNNVTSSGDVDTTKLGSYYITYSVSLDGKCNSSIKNVVVVDTTSPVINFATPELTINLSEINTYDFLSDVTVTDNSNVEPTILVEKNFAAIKGSYSIKYIATDSSGNTTTKLRKVTVK